MSASPIITSLLTTPHAAATDAAASFSLGLVVDDAQIYWTPCALTAVSPTDTLPPITADSAIDTVRRLVTPALIGKPLVAVLDHLTVISQLVETVTFTKYLPRAAESTTAVSRRGLFTGQFLNPSQPPQRVVVEQEQPLHPALRDALTSLLLQAAAASRRLTMAELLAQFYAPERPLLKERPAPSVSLHLDLHNSPPAGLTLTPHITSLGYTTTQAEPKAALGENGERLQSYVRALAEWLQHNGNTEHTIYLRLGGGYGALYNNNLGRILGALHGLAQAAKPYAVRVEDPFIFDSRQAQIDHLRKLHDYLRIRQLDAGLAAHAWVDSVTAVEAFAAAGVVQMLHVDADQFLSLPASLEAVAAARQAGARVMWGMNGRLPQVAAHASLALRPDLVMAGAPPAAALLHNELQRTLTWLNYERAPNF